MPERARLANCDPGVLGQRQMVASTVAGRAQGGWQSVRIVARVWIDLHRPQRRERNQGVDARSGMGLRQVLLSGQWRGCGVANLPLVVVIVANLFVELDQNSFCYLPL